MNSKYLLSTILLCASVILSAQVELIKECNLPYNGGTAYMMSNGDKLFFAASDSGGLEPWISDGTAGGTHRIKDIYPGATGSMQSANQNMAKNTFCTVYKDQFYFLAGDAVRGEEIWKYDAAKDTAYMLKDINPLGNVTGSTNTDYPYFCELNGLLYFAADNNTDGSELWRTDGTDTGTRMVKNIYPDYISSTPAHLTRMGSHIYFTAWGENTGIELWRTDGSENGTELVKDVRPGPFSSLYNNSSWRNPNLLASGNYVYFVANVDSPETHFHYWRTDGTLNGTIQLETTLEVNPNNETEYADVNGTFYFTASDGDPTHSNLYKSNGTTNGTVQVSTNNELITNGAFFAFGNQLYFNGLDNNGSYRYGLGKSDGTTGGTSLVKSFQPGGSTPEVGNFGTDGTLLYARLLEEVRPGEMEYRILQSNGTTNGTVVIPHYGIIGGLTYFKNRMYYGGYDSIINSSYDIPGLYAFTAVTVGIDEINTTTDISVYPNPAGNNLSVNVSGFTKAEVSITDMTGRSLLIKNIIPSYSQFTMDVSHLASGCYLLTLKGEGKNIVRKFIKE